MSSHGRSFPQRLANGQLKGLVVTTFDQGNDVNSLEDIEKQVYRASANISQKL